MRKLVLTSFSFSDIGNEETEQSHRLVVVDHNQDDTELDLINKALQILDQWTKEVFLRDYPGCRITSMSAFPTISDDVGLVKAVRVQGTGQGHVEDYSDIIDFTNYALRNASAIATARVQELLTQNVHSNTPESLDFSVTASDYKRWRSEHRLNIKN